MTQLIWPRCSTCGKFHSGGSGSAWKMVYSGHPPTPDHERTYCAKCVALYGPPKPQYGIKPEASTGVFK